MAKLAVAARKFADDEVDMMEGVKCRLSGTSGCLGSQVSGSQLVNGEEEAIAVAERGARETLYIPAETTTH